MFFQEIDPLHHFDERRFAHLIFAIFVMKLLRAINGNPYQPVVFTEELAPFVCKQGSIRLDTIVNRTSAGVFLLQLHRLFIKRKRTHQRFSTVPGKKHLRHGLRVDILVDKLFQ